MVKRGFTLIELLVVIAIMALLMAILLSSLHRVRKQAKALACQSNLRQWGTIWATTTAENDGYFPGWNPDELWPDHEPLPRASPAGRGWWDLRYWCRDWYDQTEGIRCCPMATKPANPTGRGGEAGGTFLAWGRLAPEETHPWKTYGSYCSNVWVSWSYYLWRGWGRREDYPRYWRTAHVGGASSIPVHLDGCWPEGRMHHYAVPPEYDAVPTAHGPTRHEAGCFCINRHDGVINSAFMDWSVRKVGLKELWALKWHREYDTAGPWTQAGGARPEDWPEWMRHFKDY